MDNFFNKNSNNNNSETDNLFAKPLNQQYDNLKDHYQQIFIEAAESIRAAIDKFKPEDPCKSCNIKNCNIQIKDAFADYPFGCPYRDWQTQILSFLSGEYKQRLKNTYNQIMGKKSDFHCSKCGNCCRLAVSEHSYEQLKQRAMRGDKFAKDFVSVFVPYESEEEAKQVNPEYFDLLNLLIDDQKAYYYYCPKLIGNECSDYENRPDICKDFPHNPLKLLPSSCSFNVWKDEIAKEAMLLKAKTDIIAFYKNKLG